MSQWAYVGLALVFGIGRISWHRSLRPASWWVNNILANAPGAPGFGPRSGCHKRLHEVQIEHIGFPAGSSI